MQSRFWLPTTFKRGQMRRVEKAILTLTLIVFGVMGGFWIYDSISVDRDIVDGGRTIDTVTEEIDSYFIEKTGKPYYWGTERVDTSGIGPFTYSDLDEAFMDINSMVREQTGQNWQKLYDKGTFDCSGMTACLEYFLENKGFTVRIASGNTKSGGNHAWLFVYEGDEWRVIEATILFKPNPGGIVLNDMVAEALGVRSVSYEDYHSPEHMYENIYEAMYDRPRSDYDWWNSCPFKWY